MVSDILHDLKTPLTVIRGYAQAFETDAPPEKAGEYLRAMKEKRTSLPAHRFAVLYAKTTTVQPSAVRMDVCEAVRRIAVEMLPTIEQRPPP
ncbi:MAG: histidine kinase dimerization/phospho-acceptor domain-containing protein [Eggerthellaceae bacterium]